MIRRFIRRLFQRSRTPIERDRVVYDREHEQTMKVIERLEARHRRNIERLRRAGLELSQFEQRVHDERRRE